MAQNTRLALVLSRLAILKISDWAVKYATFEGKQFFGYVQGWQTFCGHKRLIFVAKWVNSRGHFWRILVDKVLFLGEFSWTFFG